MAQFLGWVGWPFVTLVASLLVLVIVYRCCKGGTSGTQVGDPGGDGKPLPIFGWVWDNTATSGAGCGYEPGAGDNPIVGATVVLTSNLGVVTSLATTSTGYYGATVAPGTYSIQVTVPAGLAVCPGTTNPRVNVPVTAGNHREDFAVQ